MSTPTLTASKAAGIAAVIGSAAFLAYKMYKSPESVEKVLQTEAQRDKCQGKCRHANKEPVRVVVTGAAGQIGYSLVPLIAKGAVFGRHQPVILHLLDITPALKALNGVLMEIEDGAYPLLQSVVVTDDLKTAFDNVQYAILVGGLPRKADMERKDLLQKNSPIFVGQGKALDQHAHPNVKVLVVANPANTNCLIAALNCKRVPKKNFSCLTRLDMNRARGIVAKKLGVTADRVKNVTIWGNHSSTQYPDLSSAYCVDADGKSFPVEAKFDAEWVKGEFVTTVQKRGAAIIAARGSSSAMSAANAIADHMRNWICGTGDEYVSMGVWSDGSYGVAKDIIYSFPVRCKDGEYEIVQGLNLSEHAKKMLKKTEEELLAEKQEAL